MIIFFVSEILQFGMEESFGFDFSLDFDLDQSLETLPSFFGDFLVNLY